MDKLTNGLRAPIFPRVGGLFFTKSVMHVCGAWELPKRSLAGDCASSAIGGPSGLAGPITRRKNCRAHTVGRDRLTMPGVPRLCNTLRGKALAHASRRFSELPVPVPNRWRYRPSESR